MFELGGPKDAAPTHGATARVYDAAARGSRAVDAVNCCAFRRLPPPFARFDFSQR